jgi:hypothetical protein
MTATEIVNAAMKNLAYYVASKMDADVLARAVQAQWETISMAPKAPWVGMDYAIGLASTTPIPAFAYEHLSRLRRELDGWHAERRTRHARTVSIVWPDGTYREVPINSGPRDERATVLQARILFIERELNPASKTGDTLNIRKPARFR